MPTVEQWIAILAGAGFVGGFLWIQVKRHRNAPIRNAVLSDPPVLQRPVDVKVDQGLGWFTKTLGGYELIVRSRSVQVSLRSQSLGVALGGEWYFWAKDARMGTAKLPFFDRTWITLSVVEGAGAPIRLALSSSDAMDDAWQALLQSGVAVE